jgi:pyridoxamine 5'-phosphate oxidase
MLPEPEAGADPFTIFRAWYEAQAKTGPKHPDAMILATAARDGAPSCRAVLLKGVEQGRFRFFTNYESRKARELDENPRAALLFFWPAIGRQVRVEGEVTKTSAADSDAYFATRPRDSQLSAYVSPQSRETTRAELVALRAEAERALAGAPVPRPEHWGGYALVPSEFEFWQSDETRLHRRHRFVLGASGWDHSELAP